MSYRIQSVARLTGISTATLRAWERRYHLVAPVRSPKGYRLYSDDEVARLRRIKALLEQGLRIGEAVERVRREHPAMLPADSTSAADVGSAREGLLAGLLAMDRGAASRAYERLAFVPPLRRADEVLLPIAQALGDLWARGEASVAQEHFASAFIRERLAGLMESMDAPGAGPEAVCACLPGERHELGLLGAALHLAANGCHVVYLGADVPLQDLAATLAARRPALLCVSVVCSTEPGTFAAAVRDLKAAAPEGTHVVIGGRGVPPVAQRPRLPGVSVCDTFDDLLDELEELHAAAVAE
jgi:DNA-binding transcriptional MerR regulator/methylmalonyl-CoA mutase cobalamin-binding subunit